MALPEDSVDQRLTALDGWSRDDDMIVKTYELPSFPEAIAFVTRIADLAERG